MSEEAKAPSAGLRAYKTVKMMGMIGAVVVGFLVFGYLLNSMTTFRDDNASEMSDRTSRRLTVYSLMFSAIAGGFVALAGCGAVNLVTKPMEKKLKWTLVMVKSDGTRQKMGSGMSYDDMTGKLRQWELREASAKFESTPE